MTEWADWYDGLPGGWPVQRISQLGAVTLGKMVESLDDGDAGQPYMRAANVQPNGVLALDDIKTMPFTVNEASRLNLRRGDVVIVEGGVGGYGRSAYVHQDLVGWGFQNSIVRVRPRAGVDGRFMTYCLLHLRAVGYIAVTASTASMPHFTAEKVAATRIPTPSLTVQRRIADFLDHETGEIDAFIADQELLIELFTERRVAIVDRYLDDISATAPLAAASRLIQTGPFGSQLSANEYTDRDGVPVINPAHIAEKGIRPDGKVAVSAETATRLKRHLMRPGDLVLGRRGELGRCAVIRPCDGDVLCGTGSLLVRPNAARALAEFLALAVSSRRSREQLELTSVGSTMSNVSAGTVSRLRIPLPSLETQTGVVSQINRERGALDAAIADAREAIALSKERRAALISAAVTGKIEVRDWKPPTTAA
ncbi:restriction endonuclease subunit S [Luteipulveratus halotolerans]|uniref:restriction endonuclease subunit S n=1 Tax=Luteipulveratus halotolerans TaxID=1631356 RepID=UPI0006822C2F|nr:restriction endonuclease subunit S [Luteipulveratus halotolerans]